jgi:hypothetical protein
MNYATKAFEPKIGSFSNVHAPLPRSHPNPGSGDRLLVRRFCRLQTVPSYTVLNEAVEVDRLRMGRLTLNAPADAAPRASGRQPDAHHRAQHLSECESLGCGRVGDPIEKEESRGAGRLRSRLVL